MLQLDEEVTIVKGRYPSLLTPARIELYRAVFQYMDHHGNGTALYCTEKLLYCTAPRIANCPRSAQLRTAYQVLHSTHAHHTPHTTHHPPLTTHHPSLTLRYPIRQRRGAVSEVHRSRVHHDPRHGLSDIHARRYRWIGIHR